MRRFPKPSPSQVGLLVWTLGLAILGSAPGFAGPTYPLGIVVGVAVGVVGALSSANAVARRVQAEPSLKPLPALLVGELAVLRLSAIALFVALIHGARVGFCEPALDLVRWVLGPGVGALLAGLWGTLVGFVLPPKAKWRWTLAVGLPLFSYGLSLWRFYTTPMVFAFDHFVGYFAGTLYDTELGSLERLWTYRLGSVGLAVCGLWLLTSVSLRGLVVVQSPRWRSVWGLAGATLAGVVWARGPTFGHYQTLASIHEVLHHSVESSRCLVRFGPGIGEAAARLLARECAAHVAELERYFDVAAPEKTTVYLFQSAEQKSWFMGARYVYIAKPWREEIYIQTQGFPHPVLRHELAHVVAGRLGQGPFRIAGGLFGLSPDPGRIEGFATAAAPSEDDSLTGHQWAAAMKQLGILPSLGALFQLGFFASNSSTAYTVAGAFVEWIRETYGVDALKRWYGGASLEQATGSPAAELERRFVATLDTVPLSSVELAAARARFDRPAVLARKCPYQVDSTLSEGLALVGAGECRDATVKLETVLETDPLALRAELGLGQCSQANGELSEASRRYSNVAESPAANALFRAAALERLGDVAWQRGERVEARDLYTQAQALLVEEDRLRQLDVKLLALDGTDDRAERAVRTLFFGPDGKGAVAVASGLALGQWLGETDAPLAHYLVAKQYWAVAKWEETRRNLLPVVAAEGLPERVVREARRGLLIAACAVDDRATVATAAEALRKDTAFPSGARLAWQAFADRCATSL